jgi:hypothetical protein
MTIWRIHCILDTRDYKHTHPEYVIFTTLPLQQWLKEGASVLGEK